MSHLIFLIGLMLATLALLVLLCRGSCTSCCYAMHPKWHKAGYKQFELCGKLRCHHFGDLTDTRPCRWYRRAL